MKTTKEIAKEIREYFKPMAKSNNLKLSVTTEYKRIDIAIISFNEDLISIEDEFYKNYGYKSVNHYSFRNSDYLTVSARTLFGMINDIIQKYHYDRSDIMTDYFDTNFYYSFSVGKFDKPFILAR